MLAASSVWASDRPGSFFMNGLVRKLMKGAALLSDRRFRSGLLRGVPATIEHEPALKPYRFKTILDVGANRGQFTLLAAGLFPEGAIIAFEPLIGPYEKLIAVTASLPKVSAINAAIGASRASRSMNVSKRPDSSSLLPIGAEQERVFPSTGFHHHEDVQVAPLSDFVRPSDIERPSLLKIDVQGYELEVLKGALDCLEQIDVIYVEASFIELYAGQALASDIIDELSKHGFRLTSVNNLSVDAEGRAVQADFLFERRPSRETRPGELTNLSS
jgi:FkbM family methyltransferase